MNTNNEFNINKFKSIKNPIVLDFTGCETLGEIHRILKENFGFPEYYGENWDALWDCLDGLFLDRGNYTVQIFGFDTLEEKLGNECLSMLEIFNEIQIKFPNVAFEMII